VDLGDLPAELVASVRLLGGKPPKDRIQDVIERLCEWRDLRSADLSKILNRNQNYLQSTHLSAMIASGRLIYTIPESPAHPQQAYRATKGHGSEKE
jgi:hypothetical protein